jgi:hypothetical protein
VKRKDKRGKRSVEAGDKGKKVKADSDASGGNSVIEALTSREKVREKSHVTRTSQKPFESSTGQKTQYYVGVEKDKRTGKNGLEFRIG